MTTSAVRKLGGVPTLFVNGEPVPGVAYITYFRENACYADFGQAGYRLFSIPVYFGDQTINPGSGIAPFEPGIFSIEGRAEFAIFDRQVRQVLDAVPDAMIFPRVNLSMPAWWEKAHPEACCFTAPGGGPRRSCFASEVWRRDTEGSLARFLDYAEHAPYADRLCAYMLSCGVTEEWFGFDLQGGDGPAARAAFGLGADLENPAYRRFLSEAAADALVRFARFTKERTARRKAVGGFYGYTFEITQWRRSHHALRRVLASPEVDFLCSPDSYTARLDPVRGWPFMLPFASLREAGKLYFCEYDTRTFRSDYPDRSRPGACPPGTYRHPVWRGPDSEAKSLDVLHMNMARQLVEGHSSWWFDMWGGWYRTPAFMAEMKRFAGLVRASLADADRMSAAECAAWIDETAYAELGDADDRGLARDGRFALMQCGVPFDLYELGDWEAHAGKYRAAVFFVPAETPRAASALAACRRRGIPYLVMKPGEVPSADAVRAFAVQAGAHCCNGTGDAVWLGAHYAALRAVAAGMRQLRLPRRRTVRMLFPDGGTCETDTLAAEMRPGETRLWRLD